MTLACSSLFVKGLLSAIGTFYSQGLLSGKDTLHAGVLLIEQGALVADLWNVEWVLVYSASTTHCRELGYCG